MREERKVDVSVEFECLLVVMDDTAGGRNSVDLHEVSEFQNTCTHLMEQLNGAINQLGAKTFQRSN